MSGPVLLALRLVFVLLLYAFVAWAFYTIWQDLRRQSRIITTRQAPAITLIQEADGDSRSYRFTHPEITIGRDPASDLHLEDQTISARHTRLAYHHGQWWAEDLHSTNGTFLNQEPVTEPLVVANGDQLRCGQVVLQIFLESNGSRKNQLEIISSTE